jgi:hypothetical protein
MTRLVVAAVAVVVVVAAADTIRPKPDDQSMRRVPAAPAAAVTQPVSSGFVVARRTRTRVLRDGQEYLSAAQVGHAFPAAGDGEPFEIAYVASAPDGTVVLAVYKFPEDGGRLAALELWRDRRLVRSFRVPDGSFGGGLGFTSDGRLIATLVSDGLHVRLFTRGGRPAGTAKATSW